MSLDWDKKSNQKFLLSLNNAMNWWQKPLELELHIEIRKGVIYRSRQKQ